MQTLIVGTDWVDINQIDCFIQEAAPKGTLFELKNLNTGTIIELDLMDRVYITHEDSYAIRVLYESTEIILSTIDDIENSELIDKLRTIYDFPDFRVIFYLASN